MSRLAKVGIWVGREEGEEAAQVTVPAGVNVMLVMSHDVPIFSVPPRGLRSIAPPLTVEVMDVTLRRWISNSAHTTLPDVEPPLPSVSEPNDKSRESSKVQLLMMTMSSPSTGRGRT